MQFERKLRKWGESSVAIVIPTDLATFLDLKPDDDVIIQNEQKKKGKFISLWKKSA